MKLQLGYGEKEFAVNSDAGLLYDPDETDNLGKSLGDLGSFPPSTALLEFLLTSYRYQGEWLCYNCR